MTSKTKHCGNCRYGKNSPYNTNYRCIPCKRGKWIRDNWKKNNDAKIMAS